MFTRITINCFEKMENYQSALLQFEALLKHIPQALEQLPEHEWKKSLDPGKWTKLQILGHLIDSATNNHHRIIRAQIETNPVIVYDQVVWNKLNHYTTYAIPQLIHFWNSYNLHLYFLMQQLSKEALSTNFCLAPNKPITLEDQLIDYVAHLQHHLNQILA